MTNNSTHTKITGFHSRESDWFSIEGTIISHTSVTQSQCEPLLTPNFNIRSRCYYVLGTHTRAGIRSYIQHLHNLTGYIVKVFNAGPYPCPVVHCMIISTT